MPASGTDGSALYTMASPVCPLLACTASCGCAWREWATAFVNTAPPTMPAANTATNSGSRFVAATSACGDCRFVDMRGSFGLCRNTPSVGAGPRFPVNAAQKLQLVTRALVHGKSSRSKDVARKVLVLRQFAELGVDLGRAERDGLAAQIRRVEADLIEQPFH